MAIDFRMPDSEGADYVYHLDGRPIRGTSAALDYLLMIWAGPMGVCDNETCRLAERFLASLPVPRLRTFDSDEKAAAYGDSQERGR